MTLNDVVAHPYAVGVSLELHSSAVWLTLLAGLGVLSGFRAAANSDPSFVGVFVAVGSFCVFVVSDSISLPARVFFWRFSLWLRFTKISDSSFPPFLLRASWTIEFQQGGELVLSVPT